MNLRLSICLIFCSTVAFAQDDLMAELNKINPPDVDFTYATFKGTRLVNLHTVETLGKGALEFRIAHRFGPLSSGADGFYGLDGPATIQLRLDYAVTDRLLVGIGRSSEKKIVDGFVKYKWLQQTTDNNMPVTVTPITSVNITAEKNPSGNVGPNRYEYFSSRVSYYSSVMIARKFNPKFSAQLSPIYIHYNLVDKPSDKNDMLSLGGSFRYKFTRSVAFTVEYIQRLTPYTRDKNAYNNVLSLGFDIETGGHVFQVFFTNGYSINEVRTIPYTSGGLDEMRLGFNVSRTFDVGKKKKKW